MILFVLNGSSVWEKKLREDDNMAWIDHGFIAPYIKWYSITGWISIFLKPLSMFEIMKETIGGSMFREDKEKGFKHHIGHLNGLS